MNKKFMTLLIVFLSIVALQTNAQDDLYSGMKSIQSIRVGIRDSIPQNSLMDLYRRIMSSSSQEKLYHIDMKEQATSIFGEYTIVGVSITPPQDTSPSYIIDVMVDTGDNKYFLLVNKLYQNGNWGGTDIFYVPAIEVNGRIVPDKDRTTRLTDSIKKGQWYVVTRGINTDFRINFAIQYKK